MDIYRIEGKKLITENFQISFDNSIRQVIYQDGIYIALLLDNPIQNVYTENVFGIDKNGNIIWQIENDNFEAERRIYGGLHLNDKDSFIATTAKGPKRYVSYMTGKILNKYRFEGKKFITKNFQISFDKNVFDAIYNDGIYVVLLLESQMRNNITENVFGIDQNGNVIWQIENDKNDFKVDLESLRIYVGVDLNDEDSFITTSFAGLRRVVCYKTGKILAKNKAIR